MLNNMNYDYVVLDDLKLSNVDMDYDQIIENYIVLDDLKLVKIILRSLSDKLNCILKN